MIIVDDAFQLISEVIRKNPYDDEFVECNIALERGYAITDEDFVYGRPETPYFLIKHKLMEMVITGEIYSPRNYLDLGGSTRKLIWNSDDLRGLIAVRFNMIEVKKWYGSELSKRIHLEQTEATAVWDREFGFSGNALKLPSFGECKFSMKNHPRGEQVNQRALFVETVVNGGMDGATAQVIRRRFKDEKLTPPDNRRIDAMISPLNKRFKKCFRAASVRLVNFSGKVPGSVKIVRLSVIPVQK